MSNTIEALLFAVGEEGLSIEEMSNILEIDEEKVKEEINTLEKSYENRGITIKLLGNKYKMVTKEEYKDYIKKLTDEISNNLSKSALVTLAIIAYNEPVTRMQIDDIRGVNSSQMIRNLVVKGFVEDAGRSDLPGRPMLYKTTNRFLDYFNLSSKDDLPELTEEEIEVLEEDLFQTRYQEEGEEV
ncbi:MAG: SMC-Scp complex subunit ScpB [Bacilli bacterium]|nr:SMC-Scp complex subunit ScpB [Bacilli bacterium]MBO6194810.1 SMC-Scp complex subunit ScpB [Bacilli bacterium]